VKLLGCVLIAIGAAWMTVGIFATAPGYLIALAGEKLKEK
jgi:hypothetical protein